MSSETSRSDIPVNIEDIMHTAYLQYSLSVNVGRAIPDVRDGLKPGNRRILYAMRQLGLTHNHSFTKSAKVVGEVIGNYHPHGDAAVYDTMVRMAQDFAMREPLVQGQGNFGSIDGDSAAAYRYTECRLQRLAEELLVDLDKDTVDMAPTFDEKNTEPTVLPARFPNLLVNGTTGIGVGMATNIPPHNLAEVIDACVQLIDDPMSTPRDLMEHIKGPDFPTGASVIGIQPIIDLYETGHGIIKIRAKSEIEVSPEGRERIIVTEIPYAVKKEDLVKKIADLVHQKVISGISALQDESSSRRGIRIVIDVKRNEMASVVLNQLYKHSPLQNSFGAQLLVVDRNRPQVMNLVQVLQAYIDHRLEVVTRRAQYELDKAEARAHILEGLLVAVDNIDEVVSIIRASRTRDDAANNLMERFELSKRQTSAILEMRLHQLTGLAMEDVKSEYDDVMEKIAYLKDLLANRDKRVAVIREELIEVRDKYGNPRRTTLEIGGNEIGLEDLVQPAMCAITVTNTGYIKRQDVDVFRTQRRGGKGVVGMTFKDEDFVEHLFTACTHDYLLFFTNRGRMYWLKVYEIPEGSRQARGKYISNLLNLAENETIKTMLTVREVDVDDQFLFFATRNGTVKKTVLSAFKNLRRVGIIALNIADDDDLIGVALTDGNHHVMLFSKAGMAVRFEEDQVRPMGRTATGVRGIRLGKRENDAVVSMLAVRDNDEILMVTDNGKGKRSSIGTGRTDDSGSSDGYRLTNRGTMGVTGIKLKDDDSLHSVLPVGDGDEIMVTTVKGQIVRMEADDFRTMGRATQGVRLIDLRGKDKVAGVSVVKELPEEFRGSDEDEDEEGTEGEAEETAADAVAEDSSDAPAEADDSPAADSADEDK